MRLFEIVIGLLLLYQNHSWCLRTTVTQRFDIREVDWAPDNSIFVTASRGEKVVRFYDAKSYQLVKIYNHSGTQPTSIKISKCNLYVGVGYLNSDLVIFNAVAPYDVNYTLNTGQSRIVQVDFSYDNLTVMTCGYDKGVKLYSLAARSAATPGPRSQVYNPSPRDPLSCRFGPLGHIAYTDNDKKLRIRLTAGAGSQSYLSFGDDAYEVDFKPQTTSYTAVTACKDNVIRFNAITNANDPDQIYTLAVGKQGNYYAFGGKNKTLKIFNQSSNSITAKFYPFKGNINSVRLSKDENFLLTGDATGQIRIYSTKCGMFTCNSGQYNESGVCKRCSDVLDYCINCKSAAACENCMAGFFKSGATCAACYSSLNYCLECRDSNQCLKCLDGYYLDPTTKKCLKCSLQGCIECNNSAICTKCFKFDYYLQTTTNTCKQCSDSLTNCIRCIDQNTCVDCQIGFYEDSITKKCVQCSANCLACQSQTNCTQCKTGYYNTSSGCVRCIASGCISCNQTGICYDCKQGMFLTATNGCTGCTNPCSTCSIAATNCTGCIIGYYLDAPNFNCVKCIQNCKICNESNKCLSCFPGFKVDGTTFKCHACSEFYPNCSECSPSQCVKCRQGFWADTAASYICKSCVSTIPNCMNCANSTNCIQCITGYFNPVGVTGASSCSVCSSGCQQCISSTNCTNCFPTFFKNSSLICEPCKNKCFECDGEFTCLSCLIEYYLDVTTCKSCQSVLPYCSECTDINTCISCTLGSYLDSADNKCKLCSLTNCLTCNKTDCFSCEVGYYYNTTVSPFSCQKCPEFCQQCTSSVVCSSCTDGYYFDSADNKCKSCSSTFAHCALCNKTVCLQCDQGTEMNITNVNQCSPCFNHIQNCKNCYWDNTAAPVIKCSFCNYGFGLAFNNLTCSECNLIKGCISCKSPSLCTKCEIGFYLKSDNACDICKQNCLACSDAISCLSCRQGYVNDSTSCVLCETKINGCSKCIFNTATTYNCSYCQIGYYLQSADRQCYICHQTLTGCYTCNDSSTCTACLDKYYLDTTTAVYTCKKCVTNISGCQLCNSSSICISCEDSYYLDTTNYNCYFCSKNIPGCLHCKGNTICSQCQSGYYLTTGNICDFCESQLEGCIYCNSQTICIQCRTGYYLNTGDNKCQKCSQSGCQICSQNSPSSCIICNRKFYLVGTSCNACKTRVTYCDQCNTTECLSCEVGYYLATSSSCLTCSSNMRGCSRCFDGNTCLECMSSYFVNLTDLCQECNQAMFGCQNCINGSNCISCEANFFLNSATNKCSPCIDIYGCLLCKNQTTCLMCQQKYYMQISKCKLCSQAIKGCFSCVSNAVCVQCVSGYVLNPTSYTCSINTVEAKQAVQGLKLVSYYISKNMLKHVLLAKGTSFKKNDSLNITANGKTTLIVQDYTGKQVQLKILSYEFEKNGYSIIFYTDNPLVEKLESKTKKMSFRRLLTKEQEINLQVLVKMNEDVYRQILPDLDYTGSMTVGYSLNNPQFLNSYMTVESGSKYLLYEIVGIVAVALFLINYLIKFLCTMPKSKNRSTLLPHIIALKSCCLITYPTHFQYIAFCKGFMVVDVPWLNGLIASAVTDLSDQVKQPFGLFFKNLSIAGTFLLGLSVYIILAMLIQIYFYLSNEQKQQKSQEKQSELDSEQQRKKQQQFKIQRLQLAMGINYDNDESQSNNKLLKKRNLLELLWNIFGFSMVYYSSLSVQGAFYNYLQIINVNGVFYILGMLLFIYVTVETFYSFIRNFKAINQVRVYMKACLLSFAHLNPIYIVSVCTIFDVVLAVFQFYLINKKNQFSKFFILTHTLSSLCIVLMIFVSESLVSLLTTGITLIICFGFEIFIHSKEYQNANRNFEDEAFKIDEDKQKPQEINDYNVNPSNIWDFSKKAVSTRKNQKQFKGIDMNATIETFDKSNAFDMENVGLQREANFRKTSINAKSQSQPTTIKQGRRSKQRKTQQAFKPNVIEILPNPFNQQNNRKDQNSNSNFFSL